MAGPRSGSCWFHDGRWNILARLLYLLGLVRRGLHIKRAFRRRIGAREAGAFGTGGGLQLVRLDPATAKGYRHKHTQGQSSQRR